MREWPEIELTPEQEEEAAAIEDILRAKAQVRYTFKARVLVVVSATPTSCHREGSVSPVRTIVQHRRIEIEAPDDIPDGTVVEVRVVPTIETIGLSESQWDDSRSGTDTWFQWLDSLQPLVLTPPTVSVRRKFHLAHGRTGHQELRPGPPSPPLPEGHIPRISRLMALAIRFEQLIREGTVKDQADLARLAHIRRARVTQIMDLLLLAPEIQEEILFLPLVMAGRDKIIERVVRVMIMATNWEDQRTYWASVK